MVEDSVKDKLYHLHYRISLSILYNQKRERFYEFCDKLAKFIAVVGGSSALSKFDLIADCSNLILLTITITSTLSLVFGFSEKSRRHSDLVRNFKSLRGDTYRVPANAELLAQWEARMAEIEVAEPPELRLLVRICQNELAHAMEKEEYVQPVPFIYRLFSYIFDVPLPKIKPKQTPNKQTP